MTPVVELMELLVETFPGLVQVCLQPRPHGQVQLPPPQAPTFWHLSPVCVRQGCLSEMLELCWAASKEDHIQVRLLRVLAR